MSRAVQRIRNVLVATDFSSAAANATTRAAMIAAEQGASLEILHVLRDARLAALRKPAQTEAQRRAKAAQQLDALRVHLVSAHGVTITTSLRTGVTRMRILKAAESCDLLVLGAGGTHPVRELLLGTTASRILLAIRVPLLVVKRQAIAPYARVLAAVDFSVHASAILTLAAEVAPNSSIKVLHAFDGRFAGKLRFAGASDERAAQWRWAAGERAADEFGRMLEGHAVGAARWRSSILEGDAVTAILEVEQQWRADLVLIGKRARSLFEEFLLGSVARRTLSTARSDVLVVPPAHRKCEVIETMTL
jgi:universal stress protein E